MGVERDDGQQLPTTPPYMLLQSEAHDVRGGQISLYTYPPHHRQRLLMMAGMARLTVLPSPDDTPNGDGAGRLDGQID